MKTFSYKTNETNPGEQDLSSELFFYLDMLEVALREIRSHGFDFRLIISKLFHLFSVGGCIRKEMSTWSSQF